MEVYVVSACRTPIGNFQGSLREYKAHELGAIVIEECVKRANIKSTDIKEVFMGQVLQAGQGQNPARQASIAGKLPFETCATTINMMCGSGLKAVHFGYLSIIANENDVVIVGGQESMSRGEHSTYLRGNKLGDLDLKDTVLLDGLTDAFNKQHMGLTAEHLTQTYLVSREIQDRFALNSQKNAQIAIESDVFNKEIIPVPNKRKSNEIVLEKDEFPKFNSTYERLSYLNSAFIKNGVVTAGNSSGINDGAAALVLANKTFIDSKNIVPLVKIVGFGKRGLEPLEMGLGPIGAIKDLIKNVQWDLNDVDLFEINEAFAVQSHLVIERLRIDPNKVNVTGGAIALGHPIGCSGARIVVTLLHNMERLNKSRGIAALCIGGGMGIAIALEREK